MINFLNVSIWVILISGVINMAGGMLWYGPLFGKPWMKGMGIDPTDKEKINEMQKGSGIGYSFSLLFSLIFGYATDLILNSLNLPNVFIALALIVIIYIGFSLGNTIKGILWGEISKPVFVINTGFEVFSVIALTFVAYYL